MQASIRAAADAKDELGVAALIEAVNPPVGADQMLEDRSRLGEARRRHPRKVGHPEDAHAIASPQPPAGGVLGRGGRWTRHASRIRSKEPTMRFSKALPIVCLVASLSVPAVALAANTVSGVYRANGKDAKLLHAVAVPHEDFAGQKAITVVFTENEPKDGKDPSIGASFGRYGSALVVSILRDGSVFGCEVAHQALEHMGASSIGKLEADNLQWANGELSGHLTTHGKTSLFEESWEVDLTFAVKQP